MTTRQLMGCAYESPGATTSTEWILARPDGRPIPDGWQPTTCPLYLCRLPGLDEVREAWPQWKHGTLRDWLGDDPPRELLSALAALDDGVEVYKADPHRPRRD